MDVLDKSCGGKHEDAFDFDSYGKQMVAEEAEHKEALDAFMRNGQSAS